LVQIIGSKELLIQKLQTIGPNAVETLILILLSKFGTKKSGQRRGFGIWSNLNGPNAQMAEIGRIQSKWTSIRALAESRASELPLAHFTV
jgi:hypothetical protein